MFNIIVLALGAGLTYFIFKPFIKHPVIKKKFFKWFLTAYFLILLASTIGTYFIEPEQPASFKAGVELVKNQPEIQHKIGAFKSLKFDEDDFPGEKDNPADLKFELIGTKGVLLVQSRVAKSRDGKWYLVEIKKESLLRKY